MFFFFQAEDGIRDVAVTGVQTCALPISIHWHRQGRRDKLSVISGISVSPKRRRLSLYYLLFFENIGQEEVCVFLRELLRHLRGPIIVLLDNSSTHKGGTARETSCSTPSSQNRAFSRLRAGPQPR